MALYDRINRINDKADLRDYKLGEPSFKQLLVRTKDSSQGNTTVIVDELILQPCRVKTIAPQLLGLLIGNDQTGLTISLNDLVAYVSRTIPYDMFVKSGKSRAVIYVDPPLNSSGGVIYSDAMKTISGGSECLILHVDDSDCCYWKLILRKSRDR